MANDREELERVAALEARLRDEEWEAQTGNPHFQAKITGCSILRVEAQGCLYSTETWDGVSPWEENLCSHPDNEEETCNLVASEEEA